MQNIYGIKEHTCGVYMITNKLTGDFYIGSSNNISSRLSNHFNRDSRLYPNKTFYKDIIKYGRDNFKWEILKECSKDEKIKYEQYYYDLLKPTYNNVRPTECNFIYKEIIDKAHKTSNDEEHVRKRKELYNSPEYLEMYRNIHVNQMKQCDMYDKVTKEFIKHFISFHEAERWVRENTKYKGKNMAIKIKCVCDGERPSAYGYIWKYSEV